MMASLIKLAISNYLTRLEGFNVSMVVLGGVEIVCRKG